MVVFTFLLNNIKFCSLHYDGLSFSVDDLYFINPFSGSYFHFVLSRMNIGYDGKYPCSLVELKENVHRKY